MKKVKLKSASKLKKLVKEGKIIAVHISDDGELVTYGVPEGAFTYLFNAFSGDHGQDYEITELDNSISKSNFKKLRILFE